jgi:hypothetical protein
MDAGQITAMTPRLAGQCLSVALAGIAAGCRGNDRRIADSASSLPPVYPSGPAANTNWNSDAGPVMIVSSGNGNDTVGVVLPEATDSTLQSLREITLPIAGLRFDLFGRGGRVASSVAVSPMSLNDSTAECSSWPIARLKSASANWQVGFVSGRVQPVQIDSIEAMPAADSSALAVSLAQTAATLPVAADPNFRGLPFRVRSAYRFSLDTVDVIVADVVRTVNEEANPRVEHLLIVGERPHGASGKFDVSYYSRTAGPEESTQTTEVLAVVRIAKRPAVVVNVEYDEGGKLGLVERAAPGEWRATWRSAYTDC